jgi:hypothetical protein
MTQATIRWLRKLAQDLDDAPRSGTMPDTPEGTCRVWISDTLAREMSRGLRAASESDATVSSSGTDLPKDWYVR